MKKDNSDGIDALLVGYENQENMGLRSIMAFILEKDYTAKLVPFVPGQHAEVLAAVKEYQPRLIGFSLIFQYTVNEFGELMRYLRQAGIKAHFTVGGHFPSLRPAETLELLPELDTIVRFEGEITLAELLDRLEKPGEWNHIRSIAYRNGSETVLTPLRNLIADLDRLPAIYREEPPQLDNGVRTASMLASRGCLFNCSFCSIRQFYGTAPGTLRRTRSPEAVVDEMKDLYENHDVRLFLFQDDDFAAKTQKQRQWLHAYLHSLDQAGLSEKVRWKISCRVDDMDPELLDEMLAHGLMGVYLGVESGSVQGLKTLNKHVAVVQNHAAISMYKNQNVALAMGFMLFDPSSSETTIWENLAFLREVGSDGHFPINFCKMLPYVGTPIEEKLRAEGRLKGSITQPDYDFVDPRLDHYSFLVQRIFHRRNFSPKGNVARLQKADFEYRLGKGLSLHQHPDEYGQALRRLNVKSNETALSTLESLLSLLLQEDIDQLIDEQDMLLAISEKEWRIEAEIEEELEALRFSVPC